MLLTLAASFVAALYGCERRSSSSSRPVDAGTCREGIAWQQRHGTSCLCCHQEFGIAGSVAHDAGVVRVLVTGSDGQELEAAPNGFDNFFRHFQLVPPLRATITFRDGEVRTMDHPAPHGSCNACHGETTGMLGER